MSFAGNPFNLADIRRRSGRGLIVLAVRGGIGKIISIVSLTLLSQLIAPEDFGMFAVALLPVSLLSLAADAGLGSALIQRQGDLPSEAARTGFTLRLLLAFGLGIVVIATASLYGKIYDLNANALWALRALALGPIISAFGTMPTVQMYRDLAFDRLAWAEIGSLVAGQTVAVGAALAGGGLRSLALGALATSIAGTALVMILSPWRPGLSLKKSGDLLRFGLPYQSQGVLHLLIDRIIPAPGGLWLSPKMVGYLVWSQDVARWARIPADYVARVGFPAFSRLQERPDELNRLVNEGVTIAGAITFPLAALGVGLAPALVEPIFGAVWTPAIPPLVVFFIQIPFDALATVLLPVLYAVGAVRKGLQVSAIWAVLIWGTTLALLLLMGSLIAIPLAFVAVTMAMVIVIVRSLPDSIRINWLKALLLPLALAIVIGALARLLVNVTL